MDRSRDRAIEKLKLFYDTIREKFPVRYVFLFGSYAKDEAVDSSDIDVGVVLDIDRYEDELTFGTELYKAAARIDTRIEPFPISIRDFDDNEPASILASIKREAVYIS
jgi:predicted nucleotidyltransferase